MKRILSFSIFLMIVFVVFSCGMMKSGFKGMMDLATMGFEADLENDLAYHPYMAKKFNASQQLLVDAIEEAFKESGYEIYSKDVISDEKLKELASYGTDKVKGSVISTAMNVKKLGNIYDEQPTVYDIEILTGYVWNFNNENVVWLKYEKGESISQVKWDWKMNTKVRKIDEEKKPGEEPKIEKLTDKGYYKNIMELIAAKVGK